MTTIEKISVTVRMRPLISREQAVSDVIAWHCGDGHTIVRQHPNDPNDERSPSSFTFDRVFDPSIETTRVYAEGAKSVVLSALDGINATIFAYGETGSGKTYTMRGITQHAIDDICQYINTNPQRNFTLKFSALEIYNEVVYDHLSSSSWDRLRLCVDTKKGTTIENLVEEVVTNSQQLKFLIDICEAKRKEPLNSRSHHIIRLTIESHSRIKSGSIVSLKAHLNLVDLAGSEHASQTKADEKRLMKGKNINHSLLTLKQVIWRLRSGIKPPHIPYTESKLTWILQSSLGGNARTAIVCTLCPKISQVQQSRMTLLFATIAKEVTNDFHVNRKVEPDESSLLVEKDMISKNETSDMKIRKESTVSIARHQTRRQFTLRELVTRQIREIEMLERQLGVEANRVLSLINRKHACNTLAQDVVKCLGKLLSQIKNLHVIRSIPKSGDFDKGILVMMLPFVGAVNDIYASVDKCICAFRNSGNSSEQSKKVKMSFFKSDLQNLRSTIKALGNIQTLSYELNKRIMKLTDQTHQKQNSDIVLLILEVLKMEYNEQDEASPFSLLSFEKQREAIVMLWHLCHVSLLHRTQFFLLLGGDPSDKAYMEVEHRRLTWLEQQLWDLGNASPALLSYEPTNYVLLSKKALEHEREDLAKRLNSMLTPKERESIYRKWTILPEGKDKEQRLELAKMLWSDPHNMQHMQESAEIVAKLMGFCESYEKIPEYFALSFKPPPCDRNTTLMGRNFFSNLFMFL